MSSAKTALKSINNAILQENYDEATRLARELILLEPKTYQGHIFLAFALDKTNDLNDSERTYLTAASLRPKEAQAFQGLIQLYEKQGSHKLADYQQAVVCLARIFHEAGDLYKSKDVVDKFVDFARLKGDKLLYADALWIMLPESPLYPLMEGRFPQPSKIYQTIAHILEDFEKRRINTLIGERRTRLGSKLSDVTAEAKREVYDQSKLEHIFRQLINWTSDDEARRTYEEKLLQHCYDRFLVALPNAKSDQRAAVLGLAKDMVIIKHPFKVAWDIVIDWQDNKEIEDWDIDLLRSYCHNFPASDLYRVITAYLTSGFSPFPLAKTQKEAVASESGSDESEDDDGGGAPTSYIPVTDEDRLLMMSEGIATESTFAYRLAGHYFLQLGEYETAVETMRKAQKFLTGERAKTGILFSKTQDAYSLYLGTALVYYQSPRHHQEAKDLFDAILKHDETCTPALIGVGLIFEEEDELDQAIDFLGRALERDRSNLRVRSEAAWVKALKGDWQIARDELLDCIKHLEQQGSGAKELLADAQYRVGSCIWNLESSRQARKQRKGESAYSYWLAALNNNISHAPTFSSLGVFYNDYAKDKKRARRCFQKALELSSAEVVSAKRLAQLFAKEADWDRVELVARRVIESSKVKPPPGSKRKGISWPFSALGVAELNKNDFQNAIVSFQAALRISPDDYHSWVGLGESYHHSGRFIAATKAILNAQSLESKVNVDISGDAWFTKYIFANIRRELGEFDESMSLYQSVLEARKEEDGVAVALMQTMIENALASLEKGLFGKASQLAKDTIDFAADAGKQLSGAFNFWKCIAEACSIFSSVQSRVLDFPVQAMMHLLQGGQQEAFELLASVDKVGTDTVYAQGKDSNEQRPELNLTRSVHATILCSKLAIWVSSSDKHAQAVAHYNLGWAEYRAHTCLALDLRKMSNNYIKASVRAFKRSIELESGNAEFWNALGVVTSEINPSVSQHAFVRSLHLNERSPLTWTNFGTLALQAGDLKLANEAFTRAQSADPDYAHAWLGQAFIAVQLGDPREARSLFTHAMSIAECSSLPSRQQYAASVFDHILTDPEGLTVTSLIQPLFALKQVKSLRPRELTFAHLSVMFQERTHDSADAVRTLEQICCAIKSDYEATESAASLAKFTLTKTDLARAYLAAGSPLQAVACGEMALELSGEEEGELRGEQRHRARLSVYLTIGLGKFFLGEFEEAEKCFEMALREADGNPDAACLLAQVLWAQRSAESREKARTTLFEVIEKEPEHVQSVLLLGVVALMDRDESNLEAVVEAIQGLRTGDKITEAEQKKLGEVLRAIAGTGEGPREEEVVAQAQQDILLHPHLPHGWGTLAEATGDRHAAQMALLVAARSIAPRGALEAEQLAEAHAGTGRTGNAQTAVILAPWQVAGWEALRAATENM